MSIKLSKLYNSLHQLYVNHGDVRAFHSAVEAVVLEPKNLHLQYFIFSPTEYCILTVWADDLTIGMNGMEVSHGIGHAEPDLYPSLLKCIAQTLREVMRHRPTVEFSVLLGQPLLTALIEAGYIEQTVSWKLKL